MNPASVWTWLRSTASKVTSWTKAHIAKELGDVAWYLAVTAHAIGYDLETVLQMNVDKLRNRYPNGFEKERSLHRQEGDV